MGRLVIVDTRRLLSDIKRKELLELVARFLALAAEEDVRSQLLPEECRSIDAIAAARRVHLSNALPSVG